MRAIIFIVITLVATGCATRDIKPMSGSTAQVYDLNDKDNDGVVVAREKCLKTETGAEVDNYGCGTVSKHLKRKELNIQFANNSAFLAPKYFNQLEEVASFLKSNPDLNVTIEGHTSKTGSYEYNQELSQRRAKAVIKVLSEEFQIEPARLNAVGFSYDRPAAEGDDSYAHARNRRVTAESTVEGTSTAYKWTIWTVDQ
ncbi:OmpA family protein [Parashewanella curva]|uniref:OmpA family protein n=1 Tax=Parashewanella curva TaxID=2338552 RepID=A0A3L8Q126_9GAMM|nr:OmpA family protein [Parashewanella curva]RLV60423.1 OmpA family protein [Parashewanella curva]